MDYDKILEKILREYGIASQDIPHRKIITEKLAKKVASYADAEKFAQEVGGVLTDILREHLPGALTNGMLYRAAATKLVGGPMKTASRDVAGVAVDIQRQLNENAGIGLNAITPELNQDQIDGIITGICNAESYENNVEQFMDQVAGFFEGYVDDFVHENADFQSKTGLKILVQRILMGNKPCEWCKALAGTYDYEEVRDKGNDVWRRHNNCHCQIIYDPRGSKVRVY